MNSAWVGLYNKCVKHVQKTVSAVRIEGKLSSFFETKTGWLFITNIIQFSLQKVIQNTKMFPSGIKIDKEWLNILAYT